MLVVASVAIMPAVVFAGPAAAAKGGNKAKVQQCKQSGSTGFRNLGQCVSSGAKGAPQPQTQLQIEAATYSGSSPTQCPIFPNDPNSGMCWGILSGSGLNPNTTWYVFDAAGVLSTGQTDSTGSIDQPLFLECGAGETLVVAQATDPAGTVMAFAGSPCET
jgi:hypothetical protein